MNRASLLGILLATTLAALAQANPLPDSRSETPADSQLCPAGAILNGTDVWEHDPGTNWTISQKAGYGFTFIKATEGLTVANMLLPTDWANAKASGVIRGAYHYFHPDDDPTQQAEFFLNTVGPMDITDLPPVLDWETHDTGIPIATQIQNATIWLAAVQKATGKTPIIYTYNAFWTELGNPPEFSQYPLYIANTEVSCPGLPAGWKNWVFWQFGTGTVPGMYPDATAGGEVDLDIFNGSIVQLEQFVLTGTYQ